MDQAIHGICEYLIGRAQKEVEATGNIHKFYFIMRYPCKDKPVYSPLSIEFGILDYNKLPGRIQALWDERRTNNPSGAALLAVCSIHNCIYMPTNFPTRETLPAGHLALTCTVHQVSARENLVVFYSVTPDGFTFYNRMLHSDRAETDIDQDMFPTNP